MEIMMTTINFKRTHKYQQRIGNQNKEIKIMNTYQKTDNKIIRTYVINESIYKKFKDVAEKDMRKLSNIIQQSIVRYINSKS